MPFGQHHPDPAYQPCSAAPKRLWIAPAIIEATAISTEKSPAAFEGTETFGMLPGPIGPMGVS